MNNIDHLTLGELKQIAAMFNNQAAQPAAATSINDMIGEKCIVRTYSAGVWYGVIEKKVGSEVIVKNARRLWQWRAAQSISLSAVAVHGVDPEGCKFAPAVDLVWLEAIELIPCTAPAVASIEGVKDVEAR